MSNSKVALVKAPTHAPRTGYNADMWKAVQAVPGIQQGVPMATLHAALLQAVPTQSPQHCTAHIKYLLRQKAALTTVAASKQAASK